MPKLSPEVTTFLDDLNHPLSEEIERLRTLILNSVEGLTENIKWNGPNYTYNNNDRVTMRVQPVKKAVIQLIFHRGAAKLAQPKNKLIETNASFISWKENDRAIATFKSLDEIEENKDILTHIIQDWIEATK